MQEIDIWPYYQMVCAQTKIHPGEWDAQNSQGFCDTNRSSNPVPKMRPSDSHPKRENLLSWSTTESKSKELEKRVKNLDLARELKKLWNMRVTVIPTVIGALKTSP